MTLLPKRTLPDQARFAGANNTQGTYLLGRKRRPSSDLRLHPPRCPWWETERGVLRPWVRSAQ